ncbi:MAG: histidine phosphatase family protein [Pseudomonadota bacterium]
MTTWHWVRHGPTHAKSFVGWRDVPADLSDHTRINRLRAHLPANAVLVSSDLERARKTADALQHKDHLRVPHDPHLREFHFGAWDGVHFEVVADRHPNVSQQYWERPGDTAAPHGESWNAAAARVETAVRRIGQRFPNMHVIAVAHFGVILTQLQKALGISAYDALSHRIENLSVTEITWQNGAAAVKHINHQP